MTESKYFTRIWNRSQLDFVLDMIKEEYKVSPHVSTNMLVKVAAPDGDDVLIAMNIGLGNQDWIVRLHKEVFEE